MILTISIPTYNRPDGLEKVLECLNNQCYGGFIVNVANNGSSNPEKYEKVLVGRQFRFPLNYYYREQNYGHINNFKYLLSLCNTQYHCWIADDDYVNEHYVRNMMRAIASKTAVVYCPQIQKSYLDGSRETIVLSTPKGWRDNMFADLFNLLYASKNSARYYLKYAIYGVINTDALKSILIERETPWLNERDILFALRFAGSFHYVVDATYIKNATRLRINLDYSDPYHSSLDQRFSLSWLFDMITSRTATGWRSICYSLLIPKVVFRMLRDLFKHG